MFRLQHHPVDSYDLGIGGERVCLASFVDNARDIGRHVRGLLFVHYDPRTLRVGARQRIALRDDSDRVDVDSMFPEPRALIEGHQPGTAPMILEC